MSVLSGYNKYKRYIKTSDGYKLCSEWTSSSSVEMGDGNTAETNLGAIKGITSSLATDNGNYALSASAGKSLKDEISDVGYYKDDYSYSYLSGGAIAKAEVSGSVKDTQVLQGHETVLNGIASDIASHTASINTLNSNLSISQSAVYNYIKADGSVNNIEYNLSLKNPKLNTNNISVTCGYEIKTIELNRYGNIVYLNLYIRVNGGLASTYIQLCNFSDAKPLNEVHGAGIICEASDSFFVTPIAYKITTDGKVYAKRLKDRDPIAYSDIYITATWII